MAIDEALVEQDQARAQQEDQIMNRRVVVGAFAYLIPTFALGFVWHLVAFKRQYEALAMYRHDVIIPFGLLSMSVQAVAFAWVFDVAFARGKVKGPGWAFALFGALLSWSFTTIAVAAKNVMTSVPDYLLIESAFTIVQWIIVGPLMAFVHARRAPVAARSV